jgi:hypothetical protein
MKEQLTMENLEEVLKQNNIPQQWYRIGSNGISEDKTCIEKTGDDYQVYYSERGQKYDLSKFKNEQSACEVFLSRLKNKIERQKNQGTNYEAIYKNADFLLSYADGTVIPGKESYTVVVVADHFLFVNRTGEKSEGVNVDVTDKIKELVLANIDKLSELSQRKAQYAKASARADLNVRYNGQKYFVSEFLDDNEIKDFYRTLINQIFKILKENGIQI